MKSMTGYGCYATEGLDDFDISVEIKSVNRKQLDIKLSLPNELHGQELDIRKLVSSRISRGSIYVKVTLALKGSLLNQTLKLNDDLTKVYIEKANAIKEKYGITGKLKIKDLLNLPGIVENNSINIVPKNVITELHKAVQETLKSLDLSRKAEGLFLMEDVQKRLTKLEGLIDAIAPLANKLPEYYLGKLQKKLENKDLPDMDDDRLLREMVIFADKCDVSEEIARLKSHFVQFKNILNQNDKSIGRSLDFLTQEIQREINTLGVKAASTEISQKVVLFKTETEKVREQIQNIE